MSISRRHFLLTTSGALAVGGLAPAVVRAQATVKLGTAVLGDYALAGPFIVASDKGFFQAEAQHRVQPSAAAQPREGGHRR